MNDVTTEVTIAFDIPIDYAHGLEKIIEKFGTDDLNVIENELREGLRKTIQIRELIEDTMGFDLQYGFQILAVIFPELFSEKRFLNRMRKLSQNAKY